MNTKLTIILLLIISISIASTLTTTTSTRVDIIDQQVVSLYNATRWKIPDTLPWYPLIVFGDNRPSNTRDVNPPPVFLLLVNESRLINPIAFIGTGDHMGSGTLEQYQRLYEILRSSNISNIWLAIGNHDVEIYNEAIQYWKQYFGPEYYYVEDIPGWRIVFLNSETRLSIHWRKQLDQTLANINNESVILVFHRPAFPDVDHNLDGERRSILMNAIKKYDHVKLVFQGHWHGWAKQIKNNITWIITGGAGAPLYNYPEQVISKDLEIITGKYHYTVAILYPNQTFKIIPVLLTTKPSITVEKINETAYKIINKARDIYGNNTELPIRIKYCINDNEIYVQLMAPHGITIVNLQDNGYQYIITANTSSWYTYMYNKTDPDNSKVYLPEHNQVIITYREKPITATTTTTTATHTTTTTTTTTQPTTTTTTTTTMITTTTTQQITTTTTTTTSPSKTTTTTTPFSEAQAGVDYKIIALGVLGVLVIILIIVLIKRK